MQDEIYLWYDKTDAVAVNLNRKKSSLEPRRIGLAAGKR